MFAFVETARHNSENFRSMKAAGEVSDDILTWANAATVARIVIAVPTAVAILTEKNKLAAVLYFVGNALDLVDGKLAEYVDGRPTRFGTKWDPTADRIIQVPSLVALAVKDRAPLVATAVHTGRGSFSSALRYYADLDGITLPASTPSKVNTDAVFGFTQSTLVEAAMDNPPQWLHDVNTLGLWATALTSAVTGIQLGQRAKAKFQALGKKTTPSSPLTA